LTEPDDDFEDDGFDDDDWGEDELSYEWDDLLMFVDERSVIPVIGHELLVFEIDGKKTRLDRYLARRLARRLKVNPRALPKRCNLNDVATAYLEQGGRRVRIYSRLKGIMEETELPVPEPLKQLAEITDFQLFVTTTFDDLMARALNEVRFGGEAKTRALHFSPHLPLEDLPAELDQLREPVVFQLFGPLSAAPEYVVTDEDTLEFMHKLQSDTARPHLLFDEFKRNHLLFIGCGFPDWLQRFFVRTIRNDRLLLQRETSEVVVDEPARKDQSLTVFLQSHRTDIYRGGDAAAFVDEFHKRWTARRDKLGDRPEGPARAAAAARPEPTGPGDGAEGAIFLSYASEDRDRVRRAKEALEGYGLDVWFDQRNLEAGEQYELEIRRNVYKCALFVPCISENTERRMEGWFRKEWKWATDRASMFADTFPFVQPVVLDAIDAQAALVPEEFKKRQWTKAPGGQPPETFLRGLRNTIRELRMRRAGFAR
jgi:hypothetical protein